MHLSDISSKSRGIIICCFCNLSNSSYNLQSDPNCSTARNKVQFFLFQMKTLGTNILNISRGIKLPQLPISTLYSIFTLFPATTFLFCHYTKSCPLKFRDMIFTVYFSVNFIFWILQDLISSLFHLMYRSASLCLGSAWFSGASAYIFVVALFSTATVCLFCTFGIVLMDKIKEKTCSPVTLIVFYISQFYYYFYCYSLVIDVPMNCSLTLLSVSL